MNRNGIFLRAQWRSLAMLNWPIDPAVLAPHVPRGTELDLFDGKTLVSIVGFLFRDTRLLGVAVPFHRNFEEVNLRYYVRRQSKEGLRRGVAFVKEIAPLRAVAAVARRVYNENYLALPMRHQVEHVPGPPHRQTRVRYEWCLGGRWNRLAICGFGRPALAAPGSEEEFITEHYWGYSGQRDGTTLEYRVAHPRWRIWHRCRAELDCDALRLYGAEFAAALCQQPSSAFLVDGSQVALYKGVRL